MEHNATQRFEAVSAGTATPQRRPSAVLRVLCAGGLLLLSALSTALVGKFVLFHGEIA